VDDVFNLFVLEFGTIVCLEDLPTPLLREQALQATSNLFGSLVLDWKGPSVFGEVVDTI